MYTYKLATFSSGGFFGGGVEQSQIEEELNKHSKEGWEVVSSFTTNRGYGATRYIVFVLRKNG